jgi:prepilin-type N-terminal cleavage/methylation domain-containing protein
MKNQKGFSLIELLVVVIIIAIIAAIAIPSLLASRRAANQSATVANLRTVVSAGAPSTVNAGVGYCVSATRQSASSGDNSYAASHQGVIYFVAGGTAPVCDPEAGGFTSGAPLTN